MTATANWSYTAEATIWRSLGTDGDYLLIGVSTEANPIDAGADEIKHIIRYADTFDRVADDYALITGV